MKSGPPWGRRTLTAYAVLLVSTLLMASFGAGWWVLERIDPLLALPGLGWGAALFAIVYPNPSLRAVSVATLLLIFALGLLGSLLANRFPLMQLLITGLVGWCVLAIAIGARLAIGRHLASGRLRGIALVGVTLVLGVLVPLGSWPLLHFMYEPALVPASSRGLAVDLVTSIPVQTSRSITDRLAGESRVEPFLMSLQEHAQVTLHDTVTADVLPAGHVLLLAHPGAMQPQELVALDAWVRAGGRALVLADGLLSWPTKYPLGDSRNPPMTSMLDPLLSHWGLDLEAPEGLNVERVVMYDMGAKVVLQSPGRLATTSNACHIFQAGLIADCRIGAGRVVVVADVDMLNASSWSAVRSLEGRQTEANWAASNPHWLVTRLDNLAGVTRRPALARPVWLR